MRAAVGAGRWRGGATAQGIAVLAAAAAATALTFLAVRVAAPAGSYFRIFFFERSWIQHASTFCFWVAMVLLLVRHRGFAREREARAVAAAILEDPSFRARLIWSDATSIQRRFTDATHARHHRSITFSRIVNALERLFKAQSTNAMESYCRTRSDVDSQELDTSYSDVRFLIWIIPTLGFIGTVMGIGRAIAGFAEVIAGARDMQAVRAVLPEISYYLGTAFDTTLLALALSAVAVFYMSALLKRQEQLLGEIDTLCHDGVCAAFQEHSTASREIVEAIGANVDQIRDRMNGNRAQLENAIRSELPAVLAERFDELTRETRAEVARLAAAQERLAGELERVAQGLARLGRPSGEDPRAGAGRGG